MLPGAAVSGAVFLPLVQRKGGALAGANADLLRAAQKRLQVGAAAPDSLSSTRFRPKICTRGCLA